MSQKTMTLLLFVTIVAVVALAFIAAYYQHDRDALLTLIQAYGLGCPQ